MQGSVRQTIYYLYTKLIGAGFSLSIFALYALMLASFDMYDFVETASNPIFWLFFYGYGISCSILIDGLLRVVPSVKRYRLLLYITAGCAIFFVLYKGSLEYVLIAGPLGSLAAVLFYVGVKLFAKRLKWAWLFALVIPTCVAISLTIDFTEKQHWTADRTKTSFQASFSYFDGMHEIPIHLEKGEKLLFNIESERGRIGHSVENESGKKVPMKPRGERMMVAAETKGTYYIVVTGNGVSLGRFKVEWEINV
ncbi:hypothetical protein [Halobacillus naozhouensis]|uniref:Uncharacterized protein n=1 Tax=Halobacillus naozhouensis TaxID=554880 RepID=A0ABY8IW97_9BACI|nr:hypothetical protein [Halobacillus naozhouensis]WFT74092.1 hypothetical protein P9989_17225 [Halobacillus naozhouensis]